MEKGRTKVTVVGAGQVGMACAVSILTQSLCDELALIDVVADKVKGEVLDLQHAAVWLHNAKVVGGDDYALSAGSDVVVVTAGVRQKVGESRLALAQRNVDIFKSIMPQIVKYSPNCIIVVISNPADVMTYVTWKLSGFPSSRVFGTGTTLDTSRFRHLLGQRLGVGASAIDAYVIGEHGDSSVPVWSSALVGGVTLEQFAAGVGIADFKKECCEIHTKVVQAAMDIITLKGYTNWGIGMTCAGIVDSIVNNSRTIHPVSTLIRQTYNTAGDSFVSVPCVIGSEGIKHCVKLHLSAEEEEKFQKSVTAVWEVSSGLVL